MYYLLDNNFNFITPLENYQSMIWTTRYYKSGDFELYAPATNKLLSLIKKDYFIIRDDDWTQAMIVENIQITTDIEEGNFLIITGRDLKSILHRRIIWTQTTVNGTVEACIRQLIDENIINPTDPERKIDNFILGAEFGITDTMQSQFTGDNLGDTISKICMTYGLGYDVMLDLDKKQFIFSLYKGANRTYDQNENPYVIFSNEFDNLLTTDYIQKNEEFKNVALVAGEGEGVDRKTQTVGSASGINRYELFVDSRNTSSKSNEEMTDDEYNALLCEKGNEKLSEYTTTETLEGDLIANHTWQYNRDYFLGDIVEVVNEYGFSMQPQITEIIESEDDGGKTVVVTFATDVKED